MQEKKKSRDLVKCYYKNEAPSLSLSLLFIENLNQRLDGNTGSDEDDDTLSK